MCQQHPQFLTAYRLHMHRTIKPRPHHLRYAARIVAVRLVDLRLQHRLHVPRREPASDIDTGVVDGLKVLDPDGRLEKRTLEQACRATFEPAVAIAAIRRMGFMEY